MTRRPETPAELLSLLAAAPSTIAARTRGAAAARLRAAPAPGEWSANDVLAHLRSCADVWGGCIDRIVAEDRPTIRAVDPRTWTERSGYPDLAFAPSLAAFSAQRARLLDLLQSLPDDGRSRQATVTGAGRPLVRTVTDYAWRLAIHERPHIKQIGRTVAAVLALQPE